MRSRSFFACADEPLLLPNRSPKLPWRTSVRPDVPEPTPSRTKPAPKTMTSSTKTQRACERILGKNMVSSARPAAPLAALGRCSTRRAWRAAWRRSARAMCSLPAHRTESSVNPGPIEARANVLQARLRGLVAQCACEAGVVEVAWIQAEGARRVVVLRQVGAEHGGVVGGDRARHAGGYEARQGMLVERCNGSSAHVRDRADVEDDATVRELGDERGIVDGANPVPDPVGTERVERTAHRRGACDLARVRNRGQPLLAGDRERRLVRLGRELRLEPAEADADDAAIAIPRCVADDRVRFLDRETADDVRCQADLH